MKQTTKATKDKQIERYWHIIDVNDQILGRSATKIAELLMGKSKPYFVRNLDCGDFVVVINAQTVKLTGKKETDKKYTSYSGYPGGLRTRTVAEVRAVRPEEIVKKAVSGMLPHNKLHDKMLKRLYIYKDANHPYAEKLGGVK